jgi:hypothetical protein
MIPWLDELLATLPSEHANLVERFARWKVLRHVRNKAAQNELTKGVIQGARTQIRGTISLLTWLAGQDIAITTATQADLEHYIAIGRPRTTPNGIYQFIDWVRETGLNPVLQVTLIASGPPSVTMSDADRWRHVELLLHDTTLRHSTRVGGLFMLLFAQSLTAICRMRTAQVDVTCPAGDKPPTSAGTANGCFQEASPATTSGQRTSAGNWPNGASSRRPRSTPPCSSSRPSCPTRSWPTSWAFPRPRRPGGVLCPRGPGPNTPLHGARAVF